MRKHSAQTLSYLGAVVCVTALVLFSNIQEQMWPFPGIYLIEIALIGLSFAALAHIHAKDIILLLWGLGGALLAFTVLGAMSIGAYIAPAYLFFLLAAGLKSWEDAKTLTYGILIHAGAAILQGAYMFAVI
ncbi:MAG: hypothetical protein OEV06_12520 [Anaerolineae bacterium]|nr:hypothetical protein [Anaerolineae bacterium]